MGGGIGPQGKGAVRRHLLMGCMSNVRRNDGSRLAARRLIYFPILHTESDMGALSESVRRATVRKLGERRWKNQVNAVDRMWADIEGVIDGLALPYEKVRLYQDGMPVCGREREIVTELATAGSRNHRLLLRLMERGATIMGAESSELLVEEYELVKQVLGAADVRKETTMDDRLKALSRSLLKRRDQYIASRINATLLPGETGILFLGMLHSLASLLDEDIRVVYPLNKPLDHGTRRDGRSPRDGSHR